MARVRKGNPNIAAKDDTVRSATQRANSKMSSAEWKEYSKINSDRFKKTGNSASAKLASDSRLQARYQEKPSTPQKGKPAPSPSNRRFTVTRDNRPEVKGNYSGVDVNNKMVRKGKVKAAESMVRKSLIKSAVKKFISKVGPYGGAVVYGGEAGYAVGTALRKHKENNRKPLATGQALAAIKKGKK